MLLVDTSVWVDHLSRRLPGVAERLQEPRIRLHEFVYGELILGALPRSHPLTAYFSEIKQVPALPHDVVVEFVRLHRLQGSGIGWPDAHLLAAAKVYDAELWTTDRTLAAAAARVGVPH